MFIADEPFISDLFFVTVNKNNYPVFKNELTIPFAKNLFNEDEFKNIFNKTKKIYTNSENTLDTVVKNLADTDLPSKIALFKDKVKTRELLSDIYPDFYYKEINLEDLESESLKYPFVIKPAIGFLSLGVYTVFNQDELKIVIDKIKESFEKSKGLFPKSVLNGDKFIIEEYIQGDEYAIDAYFDENSNPVILNIFKHPFASIDDVSDRMYITSFEIIKDNLALVNDLLIKIGKIAKLKNFPMHIELRKNNDRFIPIEVNPLRFCGWCITDIADFAYGINPYEYFMENKKPDWDKILADNNYTYAFIMCEVPKVDNIKGFDIETFKKYTNAEILEVRQFDFTKKPMFAVLFVRAKEYEQIKHILNADMKDFIKAG